MKLARNNICFSHTNRILLLTFFFACNTFAKADSWSGSDSIIESLNKQSRIHLIQGEYDSSFYWANEALKKSSLKCAKDKTLRDKKAALHGAAHSYKNIGLVYYYQGEFSKALSFFSIANNLMQFINDLSGIASVLNNIGNVYDDQGNYAESLKCHFRALHIRDSLKEERNVAISYNNIGAIYSKQNKYDLAKSFYEKSYLAFEKLGDERGMAAAYNNMGNVYSDIGNYDIALNHFEKCLAIIVKLDDPRGIADCNSNIGNVLFAKANSRIYSSEKESLLIKALENYNACLTLKRKIGDKAGEANALKNIGDVYSKLKNNLLASKFLIDANNLAKQIGYKEYLKDSYASLAELDSTTGNFRDAFKHLKLFMVYKDSLYNEESQEKSIQTRLSYEFEKKEAIAEVKHREEIEGQRVIAKVENKRQKTILFFTLLVLCIVVGFAYYIYRSLTITKTQKKIIEEQKHKVEGHQREIIDSINYASRVQAAIMPSRAELKKQLPESFLYYRPKDIVAGDFYWLEHQDMEGDEPQHIVFLAVADSTGHGVPGAMVSVICSTALNRSVKEFGLTDAGKILDKSRVIIMETLTKGGEERSDGMDISLLVIKYKKINGIEILSKVEWSGANNALWIVRDGRMMEIKADKQSVGKSVFNKDFTTHHLNFIPGDIYYLLTDGFADQFGGPDRKKLLSKNLKEIMLRNSIHTFEEQERLLEQAFLDWKGDFKQIDDVCVIGLRIS